MSPTPTEEFVGGLTQLKAGDLGLLRLHAGQRLDESLDGFDLFTGLWWPLRQRNARAPRREVAWLVAKLYAAHPMPQVAGEAVARALRSCQPKDSQACERFRADFDRLLALPLHSIEPTLRFALSLIAANTGKTDWVALTDDLSIWERDSTRLKWAEQFLAAN